MFEVHSLKDCPTILIDHGTILTMDKERRIIEDGAVLIEGDRIAAIGKSEKVKRGTVKCKVIDAKGKIVLPGLINGHDHADQTLYRTMAYDLPFAVWDMRYMFQTSRYAEEHDFYYAGLVSFAELLKSGVTTTVTNHYYHKSWRNFDNLAKSAEDTGIRTCLGFGVLDNAPFKYAETDSKKTLKEFEHAYREWNGKGNGRISVWISPTGFGNTGEEGLIGSVEMSKKYATRLTLHVAATWTAANNPQWEFLKRECEHLRDIGVIGPNTLAAHCVWLTEDDLQLLKENGTSVAYNPVSNMYLAFGVAPVSRMIRLGIPVSLGTDGIGSNTRNMFEVMRTAAYIQKVHTMDPMSITSQKLLEMVTIEGAKALGMDNEIGSLEEGKKADVLVINTKKIHMTPYRNPVPAVVYCANPSDVDTVIVDGNVVVEDGCLDAMDEDKLIQDAREHIDALWKRGKFR
jgi:5-methylthioadenosine/S-adenosylhomocysteine deaminase